MKCMNMELIRSLPSEENLEKAWRNLKKQDWSEMRLFGREKERAIEKEIEWNGVRIARGDLNSALVNLDRWRCWEVLSHLSRKVSRKRSSTDTSIKEVSRDKTSDIRIEAQSIHQVLRSYRGGKNFLNRSTRCWEGVELAFKTSFSRSEKHRHECNPTYNSTNDPNKTY